MLNRRAAAAAVVVVVVVTVNKYCTFFDLKNNVMHVVMCNCFFKMFIVWYRVPGYHRILLKFILCL